MVDGPVTGIVLAGGRGRRMGGEDKGLLPFEGGPLIARVLGILEPQVDRTMIVANRNAEHYGKFSARVVGDDVGEFDGPLAGILSALRRLDTPWMAVVPCDVPAFPGSLVKSLLAVARAAAAPGGVVTVGTQVQPVFALLSRGLAGNLEQAWADGVRSPRHWYDRVGLAPLYYPEGCKDFLNLNTPREWREAERAHSLGSR